MNKLSKLERDLRDALRAAYDHLRYCNYGDKWERECAKDSDLEEAIERALRSAGESV